MSPRPATYNASIPGIPYFTPVHAQSPGAAVELTSSTPTLFTPLAVRSSTLKNRIIVAPMCQYSTASSGPTIGALTPYHVATLGHYALKGAALVFIEATGVQPNGRISPNCPGLWSDSQIDGVKAVADFCHAQGALCGIQLAHAGRKSSTCAPWMNAAAGPGRKISVRAGADVDGWPEDVVAPSGGTGMSWDGKADDDSTGGFYEPRALTIDEIKTLVNDWADAARRAVRAGVDVIEIHGAHGYLIHQFLSPITNRRTDSYGGSFANRTRLLIEIVHAVRAVIPSSMPLFLRLSSTEWMEETSIGQELGSWTVEETIELAKQLPDLGVDLLDVSSGGNHPEQRLSLFGVNHRDYQTNIAGQIRAAVRAERKNLLIGAVGLITEADQAKDLVQDGEKSVVKHEAETARDMVESGQGKVEGEPMADAILVARQFMREPEWVFRVAHALDVDVAWPSQFLKVRFPKL